MNAAQPNPFSSRSSSPDTDCCTDATPNHSSPLDENVPQRRFASRTLLLVSLFASVAAGCLVAQDELASESASEEEIVVLTPFEVCTSDSRGYASYTPRTPAPIAQLSFGKGSAATAPLVPITLIRRADAVIIEFARSNSADRQDLRNKELTDSVDALSAAIKAMPGLRFESREVQLMSGNRQRSIVGKGGAVTSFANFAVFADLAGDARLYERVKQVRALVSGSKIVGGTKVLDGPVALYSKRPNDLRKDLLGRIFEDYELVKKGLGSDFEVLVGGLSGPIKLRSCSENEIELWVDYNFTIRSIRELQAKIAEKK